MELEGLFNGFKEKGCTKLYVKILSANDNSKNQVYLGGSFEILNVLPMKEIISESSGNWERERFKAKLNFSWIADDFREIPAPNSQLILYPKYPEVRFSGFLQNCKEAPSELMKQRLPGRILLLGINDKNQVLGYAAAPNSSIANKINSLDNLQSFGIFKIIELKPTLNSKNILIDELTRIHNSGWINSYRFDKDGLIVPCNSSNCGGYTLEAELGVKPNGYSEPDFLGWEIKQFGVKNFDSINNAVITLMTPEPNGGYYSEQGVEQFIYKYGYSDLKGREDRMNFGGIFKNREKNRRTGLTLILDGFDFELKKIRNSNGKIVLLDEADSIAASWSFSSLLLHWNRKHNKACYVPSLSRLLPARQYFFSDKIIIGEGTDFNYFLYEMSLGNIYYDPGIKVENISSKPITKRRSQFRIKSSKIMDLYKTHELVKLE